MSPSVPEANLSLMALVVMDGEDVTVDAGVRVVFVWGFVVPSVAAAGALVSDVVLLTLTGLLVLMCCCLVVGSVARVSGEESTILVTLFTTVFPVGVGAVGIVVAVVLLLTDSI